MLAYVPAGAPAVLLAVRFVHGVAFGAVTTAMPTIIVDIIPRHRRGEGIALFMLSPTLAAAIGPFIGLVIVAYAGYRLMFLLCALLYAMSIVAALCARIPAAADGGAGASKTSAWHELFEKSALAVSIVMLLAGVAFSGIVTFLNSFAIEIGQTAAAGFFFLVHAVFILVSRPLTGRLLDARGDNIVMFPALAVFAVGLGLLAVADRASVLLAAAALVGLGFGTTMSCAQAIAVKRAPPQRVGLATSTFFFCLDAGMGGGPFLIGTIIPLIGFRWTYVALAGVVLVAILLYDRMHGARQRAGGADRRDDA
jgi:MFS family permease